MSNIVWVEPRLFDVGRFAAESYTAEFLVLDEQLTKAGAEHTHKSLGELGKLFTGPFGSLLPTSVFVDEGIPLLRVQNVGELEVLLDNLANISPEMHKKIIKSRLKSGDLTIAKAGQLGMTAIIPESMPECNITQHIVGVRVNREAVNNHYLAAFLVSKYGRFQFVRQGVGTLLKYLGVDDTRQAQIVVPQRSMQDYIGAKVQLAERCRTRANDLWGASQQVFSEAVDIPLAAELLGQIDHSGLQSASYYLATIMPMAAWVRSDLIEHELGPQYFHPRRANVISKLRSSGVELKHLSEVTARKSERVTAEKAQRMAHYVGLAEIDSTTGYFDPISPQTAEVTGTSASFKPGDILFSKLRPYLNKVSICPDYIAEACGSTELLVYRAHTSVRPYYVFFAIKSNLGLFQIIDVTAGSTLPRVDPEVIDDILVPMISIECQDIIDKNIRSVFKLRHYASSLIKDAKADIEALIEGRLDVNAILAGRLKPPVWEDIEV